jgi:predicted glycoside hydrolase/deacetylase ChbG (UPF0249 family)
MIRLIVNADDLGLHPRIDQGIFAAHREGLVTSASLLATGSCAREAVKRARTQGLALGVHLCLTSHLTPAAPREKVRWLAPGGRFRSSWATLAQAYLLAQVPLEEVELELRAQLSLARALGAEVDHLDVHQHLHLLPGITGVVLGLAQSDGLPVRWPTERPDRTWLTHPTRAVKSALLRALSFLPSQHTVRRVPTVGIFEAGALDDSRLAAIIEKLGEGDYELSCHPGKDPGMVPEDPTWRYGWETELAALCSQRTRDRVQQRGIVLTTYAGLT